MTEHLPSAAGRVSCTAFGRAPVVGGRHVAWQKTPSKRRREIIVPKFAAPQDTRPIRAETRAKLVASSASGRRWLDEIISGAVTDVEQIAAREKCSVRKVNMTISLAFRFRGLPEADISWS